MKILTRPFFLTLGFISIALAILGAFLPLLPTTPFLLLAAYFFSKSSTRLHTWMLNHKFIGPRLKDWEMYHVIPLPVKLIATVAICTSVFIPMFYLQETPTWAQIGSTLAVLSILFFIWSCPSKKPN